MTTAFPFQVFASLNGQLATRALVRVPGAGLWFADVELDAVPDAPLSTDQGAASLVLGDCTFTGTIAPAASGSFVLQSSYRIVGGIGWTRALAAQGYHNDAGIRASDVLEAAAGECGEQLVVDAGDRELGVDFLREAGPGSRLFGQVLDPATATWWVDYAGVTHVGIRPAVAANPDLAFDFLEYAPTMRLATFATDTPSAIQVGTTIADPERLGKALKVRELELESSPAGTRVRAWVGEVATPGELDNRLVRVIRGLVRQALPQLAYLAPVRYRVVEKIVDRYNVQNVDSRSGLPDQMLVRLAPGVAGAAMALTPGCVVLVQFVGGDPSQPLITHCAPSDDAAFAPGDIAIKIVAPDASYSVDVQGTSSASSTDDATATASASSEKTANASADATGTTGATGESTATAKLTSSSTGTATTELTASGDAQATTHVFATGTATVDATASATSEATATTSATSSAGVARVVVKSDGASTSEVKIQATGTPDAKVTIEAPSKIVLDSQSVEAGTAAEPLCKYAAIAAWAQGVTSTAGAFPPPLVGSTQVLKGA